MDSQPAVRTFDFPPRLDQAEIENRCARESFTWGPQALWLLCGLIWVFYLLVSDLPELAWNTMLFGVGATVPATLAVWYEMRRRKRQALLYPLRGRIGCYAETASNTAFFRKRWSVCGQIFSTPHDRLQAPGTHVFADGDCGRGDV
jgi:hypothetical protein